MDHLYGCAVLHVDQGGLLHRHPGHKIGIGLDAEAQVDTSALRELKFQPMKVELVEDLNVESNDISAVEMTWQLCA